MDIVKAKQEDYDQIMAVWESSVKATHDFLKQEDFEFYKQAIPKDYLPNLDVYVFRSDRTVVGFMSVAEGNLEMLFIAGNLRGKGYGRTMLEYAIRKLNATKVDVNEQNTQAVEFYKRFGFKVVGRTDKDSEGRDYPILNMAL
ncbi:GNAT family N-acetyltransferase [Bacteroides sp. 214]|nr:GNAT family N-acetyltransferase [Bacteroides sp. 214]